MGVKEVFTLALRTLIVCLADLANWTGRKWCRSVPLIAPAAAPPPPSLKLFFLELCPGSPWVLCDTQSRSQRTYSEQLYGCVCVSVFMYGACIREEEIDRGRKKENIM